MLVCGRGARPAVVAADQHHVGMGFGHARRHRAHAHFGDQFDADARALVGVFQIVDQFRQIFDGINVVVRRRGNQADARRGEAHFGNPGKDFSAGQLAAFARLGALGHLDLQFLGLDQILAGDAKPGRRPLA